MAFKSKIYSFKPYQDRASEFTIKNKKVLLAMPTGSGKTLTALQSIYETFPKNKLILWVTEKVAIPDTCEASAQFFEKGDFNPWDTRGYTFPMREAQYSEIYDGNIDLMVMTYALFRNDRDFLISLGKALKERGINLVLVLDEASAIKKTTSINHQVAKEINKLADMTIALTATPISSKLFDIHNIISNLNLKWYMTDYDFEKNFTIKKLDTSEYLFRIKGSNLRIDSDYDALPPVVFKAGRPFFKITWKIPKGTKITKLIIHGKRVQTITNIRSTILLKRGRLSQDPVSSILSLKDVEEKGKAYILVPVEKGPIGTLISFKSYPFDIVYTGKRGGEIEKPCTLFYRYTLDGTTLGFKNLSFYKDETKGALFTMNKNEVGDLPPTVLITRHYETDKYTKKAVAKVYAEARGPASVARIITASSNPSYILEDDKDYINDKMKTLLKDLESEITEEPVLVFSPYVKVLDFLSKVLEDKGIEHGIYHGQISDDVKDAHRRRFTSGKSKILLMSKAAAKGVNLQIAHAVMVYDYVFTAEDYQQLAGRISRLGSKHKTLMILSYLSESEEAVENCMYANVMMQLNFTKAVSSDLVDDHLLDKSITDKLDPEDSNQYLISRLGYSKSYYCNP